MAIRVLVGANAIDDSNRHGDLAVFLTRHGWWLVTVPILWALYANIAARVNKGPLNLNLAHGIGVVLAAGIVVVFALPVVFSGS